MALVSLAISSCQPDATFQATLNADATQLAGPTTAAATYNAPQTLTAWVSPSPAGTLQGASTDVAGTLTVTPAPSVTPSFTPDYPVELTPCPINSICEVGTPINWGTVTPRPTDTPSPTVTASVTPSVTVTPAPQGTIVPTSAQPTGVPGSWRMVFDDEFDGTRLDLSKWRPNWLGSSDTSITPPVNASEASCYDPAQVMVLSGELYLTAVQRYCAGYQYASGLIESNGKFNFTYGAMEARMLLPGHDDVIAGWPAFWTDGQHWPDDGEIDVFEGLGGLACYHYHYSGGAPGGCHGIGGVYGWHTFGANWQSGRLDVYYDGELVWSTTAGVTGQAQYLVLNMGLNASNVPALPAALRVDYVRVWRNQ